MEFLSVKGSLAEQAGSIDLRVHTRSYLPQIFRFVYIMWTARGKGR